MRISTVTNAAKAGQRAIDDFKKTKESVSGSWEGGRDAAGRFLEDARDRVDDLLYQATRKIKRQPLAAVGVALGVGAFLGLLLSRGSRR